MVDKFLLPLTLATFWLSAALVPPPAVHRGTNPSVASRSACSAGSLEAHGAARACVAVLLAAADTRSYLPTNRVVVVCSARSTQTKALGTTNLLLQASREALQPASARASGASGYQTPLYPKRVGSGYFAQSMVSSLSSLKDADRELGRSSSPSPFQPIGGRTRSMTADSGSETPTEWSAGGSANGNGNGSAPPEAYETGFNATVDTIKRGHLTAARKALSRGPLRDELEEEIERDCEALRAFLNAANVSAPKQR